MSALTRRVNRILGRTAGVQIVRGSTRTVRLSREWFTRLLYFAELLDRVSLVPGDIVECGVADGKGLAMLASIQRAVGGGSERHVWGFDAWTGLPAPAPVDLSHKRSVARPGMFQYTSTRHVIDTLAAYGWSEEAVEQAITLVPGYFQDTLPSFRRDIAFLHIDADLYESYRSCLRHLWPRVQPGGIVAFDEYEEVERWPGARRAVDEFRGSLDERAASLHEDPRSGKWWIMKAGVPAQLEASR